MMDDSPAPKPFGDAALAGLIASRLCHDLSNPLGAIGNGVELLEMTGGGDQAERDLIRDAVRDAQARVRFFRLAFGEAAPGHLTSASEAATAARAMYETSRLRLSWQVAADQPRASVQLGLLMLLCAETALPMGGSVRVDQGEGALWRLTAETDRLALDAELWSVLRFGMAAAGRALRPAEVQFPALFAAATAQGATINYRGSDLGLEMSVH